MIIYQDKSVLSLWPVTSPARDQVHRTKHEFYLDANRTRLVTLAVPMPLFYQLLHLVRQYSMQGPE